jgi:hypothetical protein
MKTTYGERVWKTSAGEFLQFKEMGRLHLFNALRMVFDGIALNYKWPAIRPFPGKYLDGYNLWELEELFNQLLTEFSERDFIKELSAAQLNDFNTMLLYMNTMRNKQVQIPVVDDSDYSYIDEDVPF